MWVFADWPPMFGDLQTPFPIKEARAANVTVFASVTSSDSGGSGDWLGSNNAYADDVYTATRTGTVKSTWYGTLFGFDLSSIPDGSTINSVVITGEWKNSAADTNGPVFYVDAKSGGAELGQQAQDTTGKTSFEIVNATPTGMTAATLKATGASGFWAIIRFSRTDNTAHVASLDYVKVYVDYTAPVAPTVTTQLPSGIGSTTSTGNGTITATGGVNATRRGVAYMVGTTGDPTTSNSVAYEDGDWGAEAFAVPITGLTEGTSYRVRAYATNSVGTSYGTTFQIMTKPAAPTGVGATDGTDTSKVVVTWTQSTGASNYRVYRDGVDASGLLGDVATYDDTGADAPTITPGTAEASDGASAAQVNLSLSSTSTNPGTSHSYTVEASNSTGTSLSVSSPDTGYRGVGSLTYQWQRSAADSNADYSNIVGGTTASYNDTDAPANGDGRYYQCVENADGAAAATSTNDRGYRAAISISLDRETFDYGSIPSGTASSTLILFSGLGIIATNGSVLANFDIYGANSTGGGTGWTLAGNTTGNNYMHKFCNDTDNVCTSPSTNYVALSGTPQTLKNSMDPSATVAFQLQITTPTTPTDLSRQSAVVTVQASAL